MRTESADARIVRARYKNYLKRYYSELLEKEERGECLPDTEHFLRELRALMPYHPESTDKIAVNG